MKAILAMLALLLLTAAAPAIVNGPVLLCSGPGGPCPTVAPERLAVSGEVHVERRVNVDPRALPLSRPLMVWVSALASSEIRWNGILIGRNGQPGPDRASEIPGLYAATFEVPARLVRPQIPLPTPRM